MKKINETHIIRLVKKILKENSSNDFSGEYENLYDFISGNNLEEKFVEKYSESDSDLNLNNWDEFVTGELGFDQEIIEELAGEDYRVYYDEKQDLFQVTKKKVGKINYKIVKSDSEEIINVLDKSGIYSEYNPRFAIILNGEIIGGSSFEIDDNNLYNFDIGILDEYQGYGIFKKLLEKIILDAKELGTEGLKGLIVNDFLFNFLINQQGFKGSTDGDVNYVYKYF